MLPASHQQRLSRRASSVFLQILLISVALGAIPAPAQSASVPASTSPNSSEITPANWYWGPANRWSWHNTRRLFPNANVGRGDGPVAPVPPSPGQLDLAQVRFTDPASHQPTNVAESIDHTYTDGFLVLHHGQIVSEIYRNGLTASEPHLFMSVSKSIMGTLAGILTAQGKLDPARLVTDYVPEMHGTVYDGATVRNLLDMSVEDAHERAALKSTRDTAREYEAVDQAGGWLPPTPSSAPGFRSYLAALRRPHGENGKQFLYLDQSAILIGWVMERAAGQDLAQFLTEHLWSRLGAEHDAYILLDRQQQAYSSAGFNATLRDTARFGQMMAQFGRYNGQQIVPESWVKDIQSGGASTPSPGLAVPVPWPGHTHGTYRNFWWVSEPGCGRFAGVGLGGQLLIVDPVADMVVVKFDSVPSPDLDEAVFANEYRAIDAVIRSVSGHGCD